jgi:hypothetical protein
MGIAHTQARDGTVNVCFTLNPTFPLDKDFLREIQRIAMTEPHACPVWAEGFTPVPSEEAYYFMEKEWRDLDMPPAAHRIDLYAIQRGLLKVFDLRYNLSIAVRQAVLKALFEQKARPSVFEACPRVASIVVQLTLFDQVTY